MQSGSRLVIYYAVLWIILFGLLLGAILLYYSGDYFRANASVVSIAGILAPGFLYSQIRWIRDRYSVAAMRTIEMTTALAIALNSFGALGFYYVGLEYDSVLHFAVTALITFLLMAVIGVLMERQGVSHYVGKSIVVAIVVMFLIVVVGWEMFEFYGDQAWGTSLATDPAQPAFDTWVDIIWDTVGFAIAGLFGHYNLERFIHVFRAPVRH